MIIGLLIYIYYLFAVYLAFINFLAASLCTLPIGRRIVGTIPLTVDKVRQRSNYLIISKGKGGGRRTYESIYREKKQEERVMLHKNRNKQQEMQIIPQDHFRLSKKPLGGSRRPRDVIVSDSVYAASGKSCLPRLSPRGLLAVPKAQANPINSKKWL